MIKTIEYKVSISNEQYDALLIELIPSMLDFFKSESGQRIFSEYMRQKNKQQSEAA